MQDRYAAGLPPQFPSGTAVAPVAGLASHLPPALTAHGLDALQSACMRRAEPADAIEVADRRAIRSRPSNQIAYKRVGAFRRDYLIASGLVGEPTAPVMGIAGATNMNS